MKSVYIFSLSLLVAFALLIAGSYWLDLSKDGESLIYVIGVSAFFLVISIKRYKDRQTKF